MTQFQPSSIKRPELSAVFLARTRASDWDWAQQALAMGFNPLGAITSKTSWALTAARYDQKHGARIALHLVEGLLETLRTDTKVDAINALSELGACTTGAIEHANVAFLVGLAPAFDALPANARVMMSRLLGQRVQRGQPLPFGQIVWGEVLDLAQADKGKAPKDWSWTRQLPWPSPLVMLNGTLTDLWGAVQTARNGRDTEATMASLLTGLSDPVTAEAIDRAFLQVRFETPDKWSTTTLATLTDAIDLLGRLPQTPGTRLNGRELIDEVRDWAEALSPAVGLNLRNAGQRWETALLRQIVDQNAVPGETRPRSRL